jgi:hypothetical protein
MSDVLLLLDPEWPGDEPPFEAVIGQWPVGPDGSVGRFRSNPEYFPQFPDSPSDPTDALLRLTSAGEAETGQLQAVLRDSTFHLAMNGDGRPLLMPAPDDGRCVIVTTSAPHRQRVPAPDWRELDLAELSAVGHDALVNPGGPAPVVLTAEFLRETA